MLSRSPTRTVYLTHPQFHHPIYDFPFEIYSALQLRMVLPEIDSGKKLSKFETLQMAQKYIECLAQILNNQEAKTENKESKSA